jgi:hypothetical protein
VSPLASLATRGNCTLEVGATEKTVCGAAQAASAALGAATVGSATAIRHPRRIHGRRARAGVLPKHGQARQGGEAAIASSVAGVPGRVAAGGREAPLDPRRVGVVEGREVAGHYEGRLVNLLGRGRRVFVDEHTPQFA